MMNTIDLLKNMQENCLRGGKYDDPLRMDKFKALDEAIKALENQPKYEKIIGGMAEEIAYYAEIGAYCGGCQYFDDENESCKNTAVVECKEHIIKHYKLRAGIEGEE